MLTRTPRHEVECWPRQRTTKPGETRGRLRHASRFSNVTVVDFCIFCIFTLSFDFDVMRPTSLTQSATSERPACWLVGALCAALYPHDMSFSACTATPRFRSPLRLRFSLHPVIATSPFGIQWPTYPYIYRTYHGELLNLGTRTPGVFSSRLLQHTSATSCNVLGHYTFLLEQ